jgi:nicotinamidase-related amidase
MLLDAAKSSLLVIDMQERLLPAMAEGARVLAKTKILLTAALELGLPATMSEQYPKGLGHTVPELASNEAKVFEKLSFSCWRDDEIRRHFITLHEGGRPQVVVAGIEAHVCALQTCVDMAQAGFAVYAVADAMSSRTPESAALALQRLAHDGVEIVNTEMALFELLGRAGTPQFKSLSGLIK